MRTRLLILAVLLFIPLPAPSMKPRINVVTIAVKDLHRSLSFYRDGLGLETKGIVGEELEGGNGAIVFFDMNPGLILALYPRVALAKDAHVAATAPSTSEFSLGHNVASKAAVDSLMRRAAQAGAVITDPAHDRFWGGYSGYFKDPDGHLWEIAWNPAFKFDD